MKRIIIIAAIIISSGVTAYCLNAKPANTAAATATLKINAADFAVKNTNAHKSDLATAD